MHASYLKILGWVLLIPSAIVACNLLFLFRTGEYSSLESIVERQQSDAGFCIYGSALHADSFFYKLQGEKVRKPEIVALGSSRTLQFRDVFFNRPFYNMGLAVDSIKTGKQLLRKMDTQEMPKILLLGVEPWWFHPAYAKVNYDDRLPVLGTRLHFSYLLEPLRFVWQGKLSMREYLRYLSSPGSSQCLLGLKAMQDQSGFAPDGSYYYTDVVTEGDDTAIHFTGTLGAIENGTGRFVHGNTIDPIHWQEFVGWMRSLEAHGITVIAFIAPFAPTVYEAIVANSERYAYVEDLLRTAKADGIAIIDLRDGAAFGSPNCEFVDAFHGGDVTYARMLQALAKINPLLRNVMDENGVEEFIRTGKNLAMHPDERVTDKPEIDFLQLGCKK